MLFECSGQWAQVQRPAVNSDSSELHQDLWVTHPSTIFAEFLLCARPCGNKRKTNKVPAFVELIQGVYNLISNTPVVLSDNSETQRTILENTNW